MGLVVNDAAKYNAAAKAALAAKADGKAESKASRGGKPLSADTVLVGRHTHRQQLDLRLDFLEFVLGNSRLLLQQAFVDHVRFVRCGRFAFDICLSCGEPM